jgi:predicted dehydrogenase
MPVTGQVRWGILGTAGIARSAFLPGVREAGGRAQAVASRDLTRAKEYAAANGIDRATEGYQALIEDPLVDALYIALPNSLHAEWTIQALRAGKAVLCEKPLCGSVPQTQEVLGVARETGTLLWEAFVFPFQDQMQRIHRLIADGAIGDVREIQSNFHFRLEDPTDIRMVTSLAGGSLNDVGCYPVRLAREVLGAEHEWAWATAQSGGDGVDVEMQGILGFPGARKLLLSCGFRRSLDRYARIMGTAGQINITSPFHPRSHDTFQLNADGKAPVDFPAAGSEAPFTAAIKHIEAVLRGTERPRFLAVDTSLGNAQALADLRESAARGAVLDEG